MPAFLSRRQSRGRESHPVCVAGTPCQDGRRPGGSAMALDRADGRLPRRLVLVGARPRLARIRLPSTIALVLLAFACLSIAPWAGPPATRLGRSVALLIGAVWRPALFLGES